MDGASHISAPARERAAELQRMLLDPRVRAVVPPWGGETAIDLVRLLDWDRLAQAEPTWMVGFSDNATLITPLTLVSGWATIHGNNLMDTPYRTPEGLVDWLDIVTLERGSTFTQASPRVWREGFVDYVEHPEVDTYELGRTGEWRRLGVGVKDGSEVEVTGRLAALGDGLIVYVEVAGAGAFDVCRHLHGMRLGGFLRRQRNRGHESARHRIGASTTAHQRRRPRRR